MAQVINTNVGALFAGAALNKSAIGLQTAQQRLSSGLRINSSKDDATGLAIATGYDSQIRGTNIAVRNANDAISQAQTLDGYAAQMTENLQRLYEIFVQTGDTATAESTALITENGRIAALSATSGLIGKAVTVDGSGGTVAATSAALAAPTGATAAAVLTDITAVTTSRQAYGADMAVFSSAVATMQSTSVNLSASYSRIMDTDYAAETSAQARNNILQQAGTAVLAQANQTPQSVLTLLR
ncbi:MAG: flagellin [Thiobacillus sp. SCN 63-374]|nr:MAG: flagellin [Thiobacillus sp. SCN 63-374]